MIGRLQQVFCALQSAVIGSNQGLVLIHLQSPLDRPLFGGQDAGLIATEIRAGLLQLKLALGQGRLQLGQLLLQLPKLPLAIAGLFSQGPILQPGEGIGGRAGVDRQLRVRSQGPGVELVIKGGGCGIKMLEKGLAFIGDRLPVWQNQGSVAPFHRSGRQVHQNGAIAQLLKGHQQRLVVGLPNPQGPFWIFEGPIARHPKQGRNAHPRSTGHQHKPSGGELGLPITQKQGG